MSKPNRKRRRMAQWVQPGTRFVLLPVWHGAPVLMPAATKHPGSKKGYRRPSP